ncbi:14520_t:CDS:2 [Acaulospora colombiana]|uniref:14520_t:CDS:1 n=1 Tax=Acaulospora colombiana TaxID=27376 RepID=A0ACA9P163_9GLOM|nr:14520_t:CDS:2 [Acaulospora colombiana]
MEYSTEEQLEFSIGRARSIPLNITLLNRSSAELLNPVISRNLAVECLTIGLPQTSLSTAARLNGSSLRRLIMPISRDVPVESVERIMDVALQSTQKEIELHLALQRLVVCPLEHTLMQRVTSLTISGGGGVAVGANTSLPSLRRLELFQEHGHLCLGILDATNLSHLENLLVVGGPEIGNVLRSNSLPTGLSELCLTGIMLDPPEAPTYQIHSLPRLSTLELNHVHIQRRLGDYFSCPQLKRLIASNLNLDPEPDRFQYHALETAESLFFDQSFFRDTPRLESLLLENALVTLKLAKCLERSVSLKRIDMHDCLTERFIPVFLDYVADQRFLPVFEEFHISRSWSEETKVAYSSFVDRLSAIRPSVKLSGNGDLYLFPAEA